MRKIDRFDLYMKHKGLNDNQVTAQLGLSNGVIGKSRNPGRDISARVLEQIENYYSDLNIEWLRTGDGEMLKPTPRKYERLLPSPEDMKVFLNMTETIRQQAETIRQQAETIDRLTGGAKPKKEAI